MRDQHSECCGPDEFHQLSRTRRLFWEIVFGHSGTPFSLPNFWVGREDRFPEEYCLFDSFLHANVSFVQTFLSLTLPVYGARKPHPPSIVYLPQPLAQSCIHLESNEIAGKMEHASI